ncbi:TPA: hypothetical protein ACY2HE_001660 [Yersinia enterocolitica]
MAYIDALNHLEFLVSEAEGADKELLYKANKLISSSLDLQQQAYVLI